MGERQPSAEKTARPRSPRATRICRAAALVSSGGASLGGCIIMDISATGARLRLTPELELPQRFTLNLSRAGTVRRSGEPNWHRDSDAGARFLDAAARR